MKKHNLEFKQKIVTQVLEGKIAKTETAEILGCKVQTIYRLLERVRSLGLNGLKDGRHGNNYKLTDKELLKVIQT